MTVDSILDLCTPPEGYRFVRGVWITHDADWSLVTDTIAPMLTGVVGENPRRRYQAARALEGADLLVLASAGRETPGPIHTWARLGIVHGRVQHAKIAVLQYRRVDGTATKTRAFVSSANLTRDGLLHNREVLISDEVSGQTRRPSIVIDILNALNKLAAADAMAPEVADDLKSTLKNIRSDLPRQLLKAGQLRHSIHSQEALVDAVQPRGKRSVERFVIVSPGHALGNTNFAGKLAEKGLVGSGVSVEIYTGRSAVPSQDALAASFCPNFVQGLRDHGAAVSLNIVPEMEQVGERDRRRNLHAKLVATVDNTGEVLVLVGSANCSPSGWLGVNREAMVLQRSNESDLDKFIGQLGSTPATTSPESPPPMQDRAEAQDPPPALPVFEPWRTAEGKLVGRISLTGFTEAGFTIVDAILGGVPVAIEDLEAGVAAIPERNAVLVLRIKKGAEETCEYRFLLAGGMPSNNPFVWRCDPDDPPERVDAWLTALLGDVRAAGSPTRPTSAPGKVTTPQPDDAYRVPLQRRLSLIARHRNELRNAVSTDTLRTAINDLLKDPNERRVAEMLLFDTTDGKSPLLEAARDVASGRK